MTLVTSEDFVVGAQVVVHSLRKNNPNLQRRDSEIESAEIAVMVTSNIDKRSRRVLLSSGFDQIIEVDSIPNPNQSVHVQSWIDVGFTKLRIWSLTQYSKVLYIDADCVILDNVAYLLSDPSYSNITFAAAPDVFPPDNFNAGVLLIAPNMDTFNKLLTEMAYIPSYDGGDTGFLNRCSLFCDWFQSKDARTMRLDFGFNAQRIMHWFTRKKPEYWSAMESKLKIIHFSSSPKPWNITPSQRMIDRVDIQWHKYWISLNETLSANQGDQQRTVTLNEGNQIIHKTAVEEQKMNFHFDFKRSFKSMMTRRPIQFGRISGDIEQEQSFLKECEQRFDRFMRGFRGRKETKCGSEFMLNGIPKIIHQIWIGPNPIPKQYALWSATWREMNAEWKYMLWTDDTLKARKFRWRSVINKSLFEMAPNYGEKSDILRLELLYQFGGVYVDMDFECIQSLNVLDGQCTDSMSLVLGLSNTGLLEVNNAVIGCTPKHEALVDIWTSIQLICHEDEQGMSTMVRTGPIQMTRCLIRIHRKYKDILIFPIQCFYPLPNNMRYLTVADRFRYYDDATLAVHHWGVSWSEKQRNNVIARSEEANDETKEENGIQRQNENQSDSKCHADATHNVVNAIMNDSNNLALQSKIMSFLQ